MQDQQNQPVSQFPVSENTVDSTAQVDLLSQAASAVESCIAQTPTNPNARMKEIAKIRAEYIKAKFGMDITQ